MLIYDEQVTDNAMQKLLQDRINAGVDIRIIGQLEKPIEGIVTRKLVGPAAARAGDDPRRFGGVCRKPEPVASWSSTCAARWAIIVQDAQDRAPDPVGVRVRLEGVEGRRESGRYFRRVMMPESITAPFRAMALKNISSPLISAIMKL